MAVGDMMSETHKSRMVTLVVIVILAATLPAAMFGEPGDGYFDFLDKFQTLLTGLLAVGAAGYTINEMVRSDARQEQRHRETIEISMLPSKLAVARVAEFLPGRLRHFCNHFRRFSETLNEETLQPQWDKETITLAVQVCMIARNLRREVLGDRITSCQHLFDHGVMDEIEEFRTWSGELMSRLPEGFALAIIDDDVTAPSWYNSATYAFLEVLNRTAGSLADEIDDWAKQFHLDSQPTPEKPARVIPLDAIMPVRPTHG